MYANRTHANRPSRITAADAARARYIARKDERARYTARRNRRAVRVLMMFIAAVALGNMLLDAAAPARDTATYSAVQTFAHDEYVIASNLGASECAMRAARSTVIHCERE